MTDSRTRTGHRIGIGGIAIESSTFSPLLSTLADFRILRAQDMLVRYPFLPGGCFQQRTDVTWLPCMYASAIPGGPVAASSYATMKHELLDRIRAALPLDGFYLDIHGAMSVQGMDDAEGDLATAIRAVVGPRCLISAGMDLHGNVTPRLVDAVNLFTAYRLAPHDDALETRERACANLLTCLDNGVRPLRAWVRIPVILPGERTSTLVEPGKTIYARLTESDGVPGIIDASLWVGYVWADEPRSSATVVVTGTDPAPMWQEATRIALRYWNARNNFDFCMPAGTTDWCLDQAVSLDTRAVFISDSGDNPTAGGVGDVPYMVERLFAHPDFASGNRTAIYASMSDEAAVRACYSIGTGHEVVVVLGGKLDPVHARPLAVTGNVITLFDNDPVGGNLAVIRSGGVHIIITSRRKPYHYVRDLLALGLDPEAHHVTAVKIGYLVPDLQQAARHSFLALTPGAVNQDIPGLTYRRVQRPVYPLDPTMANPALEMHLFNS